MYRNMIRNAREPRELGALCDTIAAAVFLTLVAASSVVSGQTLDPATTRPAEGIRETASDVYLLKGARIVVAPGEVLASASVLIDGDSIRSVGEAVDVPPGADVIAMDGMTIYAGLVDLGGEAAAVPREAGTSHWNRYVTPGHVPTPPADPRPTRPGEDESTDNLPIDNAGAFRSQGITTRLVAPAGGIFSGQSHAVLTGGPSWLSPLLIEGCANHLRLTIPPGGGGGDFPKSPMGAMALVRQVLIDADWYRQARRAHQADSRVPAPQYDAVLETIAGGVESGIFVIDCPNERFVGRADGIAREFALSAILKGSGREYRMIDSLTRSGRTVLLPVAFPKSPDVSTSEASDEVSLTELMHWHLAPENPSRVAAAGVRFALTTADLEKPTEFLGGVRKAVRRGLDADTALAAMTTVPAAILNLQGRIGTVTAGKLANLVVVDGDLMDDDAKVVETWVAGRRYRLDAPTTPDDRLVPLAGDWSVQLRPKKGELGEIELTFNHTPASGGKPSKLEGKLSGAAVEVPESTEPSADAEQAADKESPAEGESSAEASGDGATDAEQSGEVAVREEAETPVADPATSDPATSDPDMPEANAPEVQTPKPNKPESPQRPVATLDDLVAQRDRVTATFDTSKLDGDLPKGIARMTLVVTRGDSPPTVRITGEIVWPDGTVSKLRVTRPKVETAESVDDASEESATGESATAESEKASDDAGETTPVEDAAPAGQPLECPILQPFGPSGVAQLPAQPEAVLFRGATVWTGSAAGILENADILVRGGKIAEVGEGLVVPEGATIVDATGMHITAGLIDCHSHIATDGGVNEASRAVTADVRIADFIDHTDITIYRQLAGGVTAANILHGSANPIGGQNQVIKLRWGAEPEAMKFREAPQGIKFALGENVKRDGWRDGGGSRYPQSRMGVEQLLRDRFIAAREYDQAWRDYRSGDRVGLPPRRDLRLEGIAEILRGERWIHCHSYRQDEIAALLGVLQEFNVQVGTLQHILEGYKVAEVLAESRAMASTFADWWAYKFEVYDAIPYNASLLAGRGIVVSMNSDDPELGRHLNTEAAKAIKYGGVAQEDALRMVTLNPAKQLRIDEHVGSIEPGKDADLVLWSGRPLSTTSRCEQTWIDGRAYFTRDADAVRRGEQAALRARLIQAVFESKRPKEAGKDAKNGNGKNVATVKMAEEDRWPRVDLYCSARADVFALERARRERAESETGSDANGSDANGSQKASGSERGDASR